MKSSHLTQYCIPHLRCICCLLLLPGDQFFKFQDIEEVTSEEIARAVSEMHRRQRYREILIVADTCQAFTLGDHLTSPNAFVVASSLRDESSYAHHADSYLGLSVIERYTHAFMHFVEKHGGVKNMNLSVKKAMVDPYPYQQQRAHIGFRDDLGEQSLDEIPLSHFFSNNQQSPTSSGGNMKGTGLSSDPFLFNATDQIAVTLPANSRYPRIVERKERQTPLMMIRSSRQNDTTGSGKAELNGQRWLEGPQLLVFEPSSVEYISAVLAFLALVVVISIKL